VSTREAFTDDVTEEGGLINARKIADELHLPMTTIAPALGFRPRWLNKNPTAANAQRKAALLLQTINAIAGAFGGDKKYAVIYMKTGQPDFKGETPADQLKKGHLEYLAGYIGEVVTMRPD
jgi:hypothetical protein